MSSETMLRSAWNALGEVWKTAGRSARENNLYPNIRQTAEHNPKDLLNKFPIHFTYLLVWGGWGGMFGGVLGCCRDLCDGLKGFRELQK